MERPVRRADVLCRLRLPHHVHQPAALGIALAAQRCATSTNCALRASRRCFCCCWQFSACCILRMSADSSSPPRPADWAARLFAALTFHVNLLEARRGYLPGPWDILWSLSVEEMFYLFFPHRLSAVRPRTKLLIPVALRIRPPRTVRPDGVHPRQRHLAGEVVSRRNGCHRDGLPDGATDLAHQPFSAPVARRSALLGSALLIFMLCFSRRAYAWGLGTTGLDMTVAGRSEPAWSSSPHRSRSGERREYSVRCLDLGQRSYEVYLTHMFVVLALFGLFVKLGKPMPGVPVLFVATVVLAAILGDGVARCYSEPMNRWLRRRWKDGPERLGSGRGGGGRSNNRLSAFLVAS